MELYKKHILDGIEERQTREEEVLRMNPYERRRREDSLLDVKYGPPGYYERDIDVMRYLELQKCDYEYAKKAGARQETFRKRTG